jgi:leader peptidase (prepilin peptidase)/N-methyltransferase
MAMISLLAVPVLVVIAVEDLRHHRIRNRHVLVLAAAVAVVVGVGAVAEGGGLFQKAALGACLAAAPLLVAALTQPTRMGGGDVKLAAVLGALLGAIELWLSVAAVGAALVLALVAAQTRVLARVPLAPGLVTMAVAAVVTHSLTT